jgi:putative HD superfamily hydrolase of NAD metabolism
MGNYRMELNRIRENLRKTLKESRYLHSIGVEEVAHDLALIYGCDTQKAILAGLLHDCAKYLTDDEQLAACKEYELPVTEIERQCAFLLHAKVGAAFAHEKYGVVDTEILNAITYHTTGRPAMTVLEKIIFTADYIEPYRKPVPRMEEIRRAAYEDLNTAVLMILENTLKYLRECGKPIDQVTEETYAYYEKLLFQPS